MSEVELLADLADDRFAAALAELDGAARQSPADHTLHFVGNVEHE